MLVLTLSLILSAPDKAALDAAEVAHAQGLLEEVDGNVAPARELLLKAVELWPQNVDFAYDLARIAFNNKLGTVESDITSFMALEPKTAQHKVLRSYLLARDKRFAEAREMAQGAAQLDPANSEATGLTQTYDSAGLTRTVERTWGFSATVRPEVDSNVTLIPDAAPFGQGGLRLGLGAAGWFMPRFGQTKLNLRVDVNGGIHLTNRAVLAPFDFFSVRPSAGVEQTFGDNAVSGTLSMNQVLLGGFTTHFLQDFGLLLQYRRKLPALLWLSVLADLGYRDFVSGPYNRELTFSDRDGFRGLGGASLTWAPRAFALSLRAAIQGENADGLGQRELGPDINLNARYNVWRLTFAAGFGYQGRLYGQSAPYYGTGANRADHRLMPSVTVSLAATSWLDVEAGYLFIRNVSNVGAGFDYSRHIAQIAIRGHY